jgi:hypothetical protein
VADLAASTAWYVDKFGLSVKQQIPKTNGVAATILEGGGLTVELVQRDDAAPPIASAERIHGIFKVGFVIDDLDGTLSALRQRGVDVVAGPFQSTATQRANVILRDNKGNLIQLFGRS